MFGGLTDQVLLTGGIALALLEIVEELLGITAPAVGSALGDEAEHLHAAVVAHPQIPVLAAHVDGRCFLTDGIHIAETREPYFQGLLVSGDVQSSWMGHDLPNHQLVVTSAVGVVGVRGGKDVVGDVSADILGVVAP